MKSYQGTVQTRMTEFLQSHVGKEHGWKKKAADFLGMSPQNLYTYLTGIQLPGNTLQFYLHKKGCSIDWLMFGESITTKFGNKV
ncbi:MAG: hypothetical protein H3C35_03520 [Bacteroidetes bacterium]|nr:hypothetical protein [Bacteroidota bacterium]